MHKYIHSIATEFSEGCPLPAVKLVTDLKEYEGTKAYTSPKAPEPITGNIGKRKSRSISMSMSMMVVDNCDDRIL